MGYDLLCYFALLELCMFNFYLVDTSHELPICMDRHTQPPIMRTFITFLKP